MFAFHFAEVVLLAATIVAMIYIEVDVVYFIGSTFAADFEMNHFIGTFYYAYWANHSFKLHLIFFWQIK
ncbi:hypothetical protein [Methanobrevibacter sp.]|uniref:hypothetical protein n=1 Tax=Methanobrevibacter sp. TaxID=66852 RepID=UPI00386AE292